MGLYHVGARAYDPRTARWLQRDPIDAASGDPNLYRYCGNDPINRADPSGLYQSRCQNSEIPACAESPHSLPSPPLTRGERVGVRGDSSHVHSRTLAAQLVLCSFSSIERRC